MRISYERCSVSRCYTASRFNPTDRGGIQGHVTLRCACLPLITDSIVTLVEQQRGSTKKTSYSDLIFFFF